MSSFYLLLVVLSIYPQISYGANMYKNSLSLDSVLHGMPKELKIVTVDCPHKDVLRRKTEDLSVNELLLAQEIGETLLLSIKPHLPAAGLAAPQIGISKSVFIYSYNRAPENLEIVINPSFIPIGETKIKGWEGCFSVILSRCQLAFVPRYEKIKVSYLNREGKKVEKILDGFAAKVFQHEYDHLQGIVNIDRSDSIVKEFDNKDAMFNFIQMVKKEDSTHYKNPDQK